MSKRIDIGQEDLPEPRDVGWVRVESSDVHFGRRSEKHVIVLGLGAVDLRLSGLIYDFVFGQGNRSQLVIQSRPHVAVRGLSENSSEQDDSPTSPNT